MPTALRFATVSDLHLNTDFSIRAFKSAMLSFAEEVRPDVLILAGDLTSGAGQTSALVRELKGMLGIDVYYVPGNHELWNRYNGLTTEEIYQFFRADENCLTGQIVTLPGNIRLLGDVHWYDYSYAEHQRYTMEQFAKKMLRGSRWQDAYYVDWFLPDASVTKRMIEEQRHLLSTVSGERLIYVSHMINHPNYAVPSRRFELWAFFNAYLGSVSLHDLIQSVRPEVAICGHVHHRRNFCDNGTHYICACLGYKKEWRYLSDKEHELESQIRASAVIKEMKIG